MDDFKREIWMQVRAQLASGGGRYICNALKAWLTANGILPSAGSVDRWQPIFDEFFPELARLYDKRLWYRSGESYPEAPEASYPPWFESDWIEPRLALVDHILISSA